MYTENVSISYQNGGFQYQRSTVRVLWPFWVLFCLLYLKLWALKWL